MINKEYERRAAAGELPNGRVRGAIVSYDKTGSRNLSDDRITLRVTESDVDGIVPGQVVGLGMELAKDENYRLGDLEHGWAKGEFESVPPESEVTFLHCSLTEGGELDAVAYDFDTIERAEVPGYR